MKKPGDGIDRVYHDFGSDINVIPRHLNGDSARIIEDVFGEVSASEDIMFDRMLNSAVLGSKTRIAHY